MPLRNSLAVMAILVGGVHSFSTWGESGRFRSNGAGVREELRSPPAELQQALTLMHQKPVRGFAFSPDSKQLATSTEDGAAFVWDLATGEMTGVPLQKGQSKESFRRMFKFLPSFQFVFGADGNHLIWVFGKSATVWSILTGEVVFMREDLEAATVSPNGMMLAFQRRGEVAFFDIATRRERRSPVQGNLGSFSPDGRVLVVGTADGITLVPVSGGDTRTIAVDVRKHGSAWSFSPDSRLLATFATRWKVGTATWVVGEGALAGPKITGGFLGFSSDSKLLATLDREGVGLWSVASGELVGPKMKQPSSVYAARASLLFSPRAPLFVIATAQYSFWSNERTDSPSEVWDVRTLPPRMVERIGGAIPITFSPDGEYLAYQPNGWGQRVALWNVAQLATVASLVGQCPIGPGPSVPDWFVAGVRTRPTFSPDGAWFACGASPTVQTVALWATSRLK